MKCFFVALLWCFFPNVVFYVLPSEVFHCILLKLCGVGIICAIWFNRNCAFCVKIKATKSFTHVPLSLCNSSTLYIYAGKTFSTQYHTARTYSHSRVAVTLSHKSCCAHFKSFILTSGGKIHVLNLYLVFIQHVILQNVTHRPAWLQWIITI